MATIVYKKPDSPGNKRITIAVSAEDLTREKMIAALEEKVPGAEFVMVTYADEWGAEK